jgi:hypothetical protein
VSEGGGGTSKTPCDFFIFWYDWRRRKAEILVISTCRTQHHFPHHHEKSVLKPFSRAFVSIICAQCASESGAGGLLGSKL